MSKHIIYENAETNWYAIEIFKNFDIDGDWTEQVNEAIKNDDHFENELFESSSLEGAMDFARKLITRDDDYNYAIVSLMRYSDWGTSEEVCEDAVCVAELWSAEVVD